jgi:hypothetical protein
VRIIQVCWIGETKLEPAIVSVTTIPQVVGFTSTIALIISWLHGDLPGGRATSEIIATPRRLLLMLAGSPDGLSEPVLLVYGFGTQLIASPVNDGLATAQAKRVRQGGRAIILVRIRMTEDGQQALGS